MEKDDHLAIEHYKARSAMHEASYKHHSTLVIESNKGTVELSIAALKALFLANGGAAIACLAFVGNSRPVIDYLSGANVAVAIIWFTLGVAAATLAAILGYFTQYVVTEAINAVMIQMYNEQPSNGDKPPKSNLPVMKASYFILLIACITCGLVSLAMFVGGMLKAIEQ